MLRRITVCLLLVMTLVGCNRAEEARRKAAANKLKQLGLALHNDQQDDVPNSKPSHVITVETEYYTTGPQQGRPPDGKFSSGTSVNIVKDAGSYTLVRTEEGVEAYVAADAVKKAEVTADVSAVVEGGNQFAFDLYQRLQDEQGNLFFSPASISLALAMTSAGAAGDTEIEMAKTLHFEMPKKELHGGMAALQASWRTSNKKQGYRLNVANRLWGQQSYEFLPEFLGITRNQYGAELARLDFQKETEKARQTINGWVEEQTEKKITNLIPSADTVRDARLVLTNAVYFKGDWSVPFTKELTNDEEFHLSLSEKIKVPLMHKQDDFRYVAADGVQVLELPYGDSSLSMIVVLPEKVDGLGNLGSKLTAGKLQEWSKSMKKQEVIVFLPKFKSTFEFELSDTLRSMGMTSAFDAQTADFTGMTGGKDLFISAVLHKAFVDVNEEGTEAAAATGSGPGPDFGTG